MKSVLITGASTGIGKATALELAKKDFQVFAGVRTQKDADSLKQADKRLTPVILDVTKSDQIEKCFEQISKLSPSEFHLINNAGIVVLGPVEAIPMKEFRKQFDINVFGLIETTQTFLPLLRATKGRVINISSIAGLQTTPFIGAYCASKYAVEAVSDALRRELAAFGVRVIIIEPGSIATPIWDKSLKTEDDSTSHLNQKSLDPYRKSYNTFVKFAQKVAGKGRAVENVTDQVLEALQSQDPSPRKMVVSASEWLQVKMSRNLPATWIDKGFSMGLKSKN
jgi:NAD(P)-dependent dehydrogenase (short-subunit alcohol dehydrogenase family)